MPLRFHSDGLTLKVVGATYADRSQQPGAGFQSVSPDYFKTFGIPLLRGRTFNESGHGIERAGRDGERGVCPSITSKGLDPLQQRLSIEADHSRVAETGSRRSSGRSLASSTTSGTATFASRFPRWMFPSRSRLSPNVNIGVRTAEDPAAMSKTIAAAVHSVDPQIALARLRTMDQVKTESLGEDRYTMVLFASFAGVALLLAAVGIYGLMAFAVSQRTNEIGLRLALGASRLQVIGLILNEASLLAAIGLGIGLVGSVLVGRTMRITLYGVGAIEFSVIVSVGVILFGAALFASYLPARRAAMIDPMKALRTD